MPHLSLNNQFNSDPRPCHSGSSTSPHCPSHSHTSHPVSRVPHCSAHPRHPHSQSIVNFTSLDQHLDQPLCSLATNYWVCWLVWDHSLSRPPANSNWPLHLLLFNWKQGQPSDLTHSWNFTCFGSWTVFCSIWWTSSGPSKMPSRRREGGCPCWRRPKSMTWSWVCRANLRTRRNPCMVWSGPSGAASKGQRPQEWKWRHGSILRLLA